MDRSTRLLIAAAAFLVLVLVWGFWPSTKITNADSTGKNVIAFGDSLTAGFGAASGEDYPTRLSQRINVPVINAGVSGDTTESALARLDADVLANDPRIVIVGLGGNDFLRQVPLSQTESNLRTIIRRIQERGAMVVLLGFAFPSITTNYEKMYARVAREEGCLLVPDLLDGILSDPQLKSDEIHPNGRGYELMAERVAGRVGRVVPR